jgi:hypothetical protein
MPDNDDGGWWQRVRAELVGPWDWVAAGVGATGGLIASAAVFHTDMGACVGAGALGAVTAKKAGVAAYQLPVLMRRTREFINVIEEDSRRRHDSHRDLLDAVKRDLELLERKVITPEQYKVLLDGYVDRFRQMPTPSLPPPSPLPPPQPPRAS